MQLVHHYTHKSIHNAPAPSSPSLFQMKLTITTKYNMHKIISQRVFRQCVLSAPACVSAWTKIVNKIHTCIDIHQSLQPASVYSLLKCAEIAQQFGALSEYVFAVVYPTQHTYISYTFNHILTPSVILKEAY